MAEPLPDASWLERLMFFVGRRDAVQVEGDSMAPTLTSGDAVLIRKHRAVRPGEIILALHPFKQGSKLIKRVRDLAVDGDVFLVGDNEVESTDSRSFGRVAAGDILGIVTCRLK